MDPSGLDDFPGGRIVFIGDEPGSIVPEFRNAQFDPATGRYSIDFRFYYGEMTRYTGDLTVESSIVSTSQSFSIGTNERSAPGRTLILQGEPVVRRYQGSSYSTRAENFTNGNYGPDRSWDAGHWGSDGWVTLTGELPYDQQQSGFAIFSGVLQVEFDATLRYRPPNDPDKVINRIGSVVWQSDPVILMRYPSGRVTNMKNMR